MPFSSAPERVSIRANVLAALTLIVSLLAAGIARADITGSWTTSGSSGSAIVMGIEVTQSGVLDGSAYTNQSFNSGSYWSNPYGGAVSGGPGLWFTTPADPNATRTVTVTFSKPIDNPVLHVNKMGGFGRTNPNPAVSNSSVWTLVGSNSQGGSVNLSRLSGNPAFQVSGSSFQREPWVSNVQEIADCRADNLGTGCGSVMFNGTGITSLTFRVTSEGANFNGRLDGLSMRWSFAGSTVTVKKQSIGSTGSFAFQANQGIGAFNLDTTQANPATSSLYRVQDHSQPINIGETVPAGATVTASCVDGANRSVSSTLTGGSLSVAALAYGGNQDLTCTFVNSRLPTIQISKVSQGGTGTFGFSGSNGVAAHSIVTSAPGAAVAGPVQTLAAAGVATTISEASNPDYLTPSITCSGLASGGNYVVSGYAVEFDAAATAAGAAIACTYTNTRKSPSLAVTKTVDKASTGTLGETLNYTITVKNTGNVDQTGIRVADTLPDGTAATLSGPSGDSGIAGTLEVGETWSYTATYRVTQKDLDAGSNLVNRVSVTSDQVTSPASAQATTSVAQQPALRLTKTQTSGPNPVTAAGQVIGYTITLTNTGNVAQTGIDISDSLPDGAVVALAGPSGDGGVAGTLEVGETWTYAISYTVTQADLNTGKPLVNTAQATSRQVTTPVTGRATTPVDVSPGLRLVKTAGAPSGSTAGSTITYSFTLTNTGNVPLSNVSVAETLPGVVLSGNPVASLAVGESRTITGRYTLKQEDIERGFVVNSATASGRDPGNNPVESAQSSTETRLVQAPKLTLQKTAGVPSSDRAGGKITYSFTVKNEGNVTLSRIAIGDDQLDAPAACQATTLAPGASTTCTGTHTLTQADVNAGKVDNTARVSGQSGSTIVTSDPASASVSIAEKGALTLRKTAGAPSGSTVGSTITYSFTVKNEGNVTLSDVTLSDALPGVVVSGGPIASLAPGAVDSTTFTARYTLTQADIEAGRVTNTATASGQAPSGGRVASPPDTVNTTLPAAPKLTLTKTAGTPTGQNAGSTITYTFKVKNEGNVRITGIAIADPKVTGLACDVTALDPNQVATCTGTHSLTQAEVDAGKVDNSATASGKPSRGDALVVSNPASTSTPLARRGAIAVEKTASAPSGNTAGSKIVYAFKVTNTGSVTLTNVRLTEQLAGAVLSGGPIALLAPGAVDSTTFTASYTLTQADIDRGSVENAVTGTGTTPDNKQVNAGSSVTSKVNAAAKLSLVKRAGTPTGSTVGATIPYSFTVKNEGNVTLRNVTLSDELAGVVVRGGPIAALAPGAVDSTTFTASYTLTQADIDAGKVDNSATTSGQTPAGANVSASSAVSVPLTRDPALTLTKQATAGNPFAAVGDKITYRYVVKNSGNVTITRPITVNDDKIAAVACAALPASGLVPGATLICSATYVVTQADIDAGSVTNRATATDGSARSNEATATVPATARPALAIVKKAGMPSGSSVGSTIDYAFTVTNTGNLTLSNVTVRDALAGVAVKGGPIAELKPGQSDSTSFTARYTLTQDDLNRGEVKNSATASGSPPGGAAPITSAPSDVTTKVSTSPSLKIEKRAGAPSGNSVGSTIDYTFAITNTGNVDLKDVSVADALPGIVVTGGPIALLKVGQVDSTTIKARYTLTQKDIDAGKVDNSAIATGSPPGGGAPVTSPASSISTPIDQKAKIELAKTAQLNDVDRNGIFAPGDTITYSFTVTNTGNVTIDEVLPVDAGPTFNGRPAGGKLGPFSPGAVALAPGQKGIFTATYVLTQADIDAGAGVANGVANIATARGYFRRGGASGGTPVDAPQAKATVDLPAAAPSDIAITKQAGLRMIRRGEKAPWIIKVANKTDRNVAALNVTDRMPSGFRYVDGTASIDGVAATPVVNGLNVLFRNIKLGPRQEVVIRLQTLALSSATPGRHTNVAVATGPTGNVLAPPASAAIEIMVEPVFDCGDIIGKVFDDKNRNGYQDDGEPGLPGVRVATVNGVLITTDPYGRFHVACADLPNNRIGSNFIMKLDPRTLPTGYRLTTENPRVIRLTAGKTSKLNFGAALGRVVRLELKDEAFVPGSLALKPAWSEGVDKLIAVLRQEQSTLRIFSLSSNPDLANRRVSAVEGEIGRRWKEAGEPYELSIETRVETGR